LDMFCASSIHKYGDMMKNWGKGQIMFIIVRC
jgi:hypothetical protein